MLIDARKFSDFLEKDRHILVRKKLEGKINSKFNSFL